MHHYTLFHGVAFKETQFEDVLTVVAKMVHEEPTSTHEPTWDVEVSWSLLVGRGRRSAVGVH